MKFFWSMAAVAGSGVVTSGMYLLDFVNRDQDYYILYNEESMGFGYVSGGEYVIQGTDVDQLTFSGPLPGDGVEINGYEKRYLGGERTCANPEDYDSYIELPLLLYKGYRATDKETGMRLELFYGNNNRIRVRIPAGYAGSVQVRFVSPFYWRIAELITLGTVVLLVAVRWRYRRKAIC